jgi:hypothetical protein
VLGCSLATAHMTTRQRRRTRHCCHGWAGCARGEGTKKKAQWQCHGCSTDGCGVEWNLGARSALDATRGCSLRSCLDGPALGHSCTRGAMGSVFCRRFLFI